MVASQTILVTGGCGFIGSNFIHYWLEHHPTDTIITLDSLTYSGHLVSLQDVEGKFTFIHGSITDVTLVEKAMRGVDLVVHFAAESHVDRSISNPQIFLETNVMGTYQLLQAALSAKVKRFHHISTDEVFGSLSLEGTDAFTEQTPYNPRSPYAASKAASDHLVRAFGETYGLPFSITNCSNNYGEYHLPEKMIPKAITNLIQGKPVEVYGNGKHVRDWLYVQDHCRAIERVVMDPSTIGKTYLVGGLTKHTSNLELAHLLVSLFNASPSESIVFVKDRPGHDQRYSVNWQSIHDDLGWEPTVTLEEGLEKTVNWFKHHVEWWQPLLESASVGNRFILE